MNRIDVRPPVVGLNHGDGGQMQRRVLQELERQWLDSWGLAHAAQPEAAGAPPNLGDAAAGSNAASERKVAEGIRPSAAIDSSTSTGQASHDARAAALGGRADRATAQDSTRPIEGRPQRNAAAQRAPSKGRAAGATVAESNFFGGQRRGSGDPAAGLVGGAASLPGSPAAGVTPSGGAPLSPAMGGPREAAWDAVPPLTMPSLGQALSEASAGSLQSAADEAEAMASRAFTQMPSPRSSASDFGLQRLTLREVAQDHVLATLRDAQLDNVDSQLAAQSLARALMEVGYAQVKVVVNGQRSEGERIPSDDADVPGAKPAAGLDLFAQTAGNKELSHGN